mgnify:CR=1 FL=1
MGSKLLKQVKQTDLGVSNKTQTYSQFIFSTSLTYRPPVVTPSKTPDSGFTKGGTIPGEVIIFPPEPPSNDIMINAGDYLLINSTDKFII